MIAGVFVSIYLSRFVELRLVAVDRTDCGSVVGQLKWNRAYKR